MTVNLGNSLNSTNDRSRLWFGSDNEDTFNFNLKTRKQQLEQNGVLDYPITYDFNEHGFRSEEFTEGPSPIVFLGASDTVGTGVMLEDLWTYRVATALSMRHFNLGAGAASGDAAFRIAQYWLPKLNPSVVVMLTPKNVRLEVITENKFFQLAPHFVQNAYKKDRDIIDKLTPYYKLWSAEEDNLFLNQKRNELAVAKLAADIGAKFVLVDSNADWEDIDLARDLIHAGKKSNHAMAELVLSKI